MENQGEIILYQPDKEVKLEVRLENETVWLSIDEMSQLFGRDISVIGKHIRNIFKEGELVKDSVWAKFAYTASDGKVYQVDYYNLDVIISHFFKPLPPFWYFPQTLSVILPSEVKPSRVQDPSRQQSYRLQHPSADGNLA